MKSVLLRFACDDVVGFACDALLLKYANSFYGADLEVAKHLIERGQSISTLAPTELSYSLVAGRKKVRASTVLFLPVGPLRGFGYPQMERFAARGLSILAKELPGCRRLALTVHGPGYGLDEVEGLLSLVSGCVQALEQDEGPPELEEIVVVERSKRRAVRLYDALEEHLVSAPYAQRDGEGFRLNFGSQQPAIVPRLTPKEHIFVAMPFAPELEDVFYYGIQQPVRAQGYICERVDKSVFSGDIVGRIKERIATSAAVIADLSGANANVYLEVGYAWGLDRPTILICKSLEQLCFDVRGSRCLEYRSVKQLEQLLHREIESLLKTGGAP